MTQMLSAMILRLRTWSSVWEL